MPRPAPVDYLQPDEVPLLEARRHPLSIVDDVLAALVVYAVAVGPALYAFGVLWPELWGAFALPLLSTATAVLLAFVAARWWRVQTSRYIITAERVYKCHGRLRFFLGQTTYDKVTDLHTKQSLFGRLWGFGTVRLETAGAGLPLEGLRDPPRFKREVEKARARFIRSLAQEGARRAEPPSEGAWPAEPYREDARTDVAEAAAEAWQVVEAPGEGLHEEADLWQGRPSAPYALGKAGWGAALLLAGAALLVAAGQGVQAVLLPGALLSLFGASRVFQGTVEYRFTRYHLRPGGVVVTSGWLTRRRSETTFDKVTDVETYQSLLGRVLDFGHISINTAGSGQAPVAFRGLAYPDAVKGIIDDARRRWRSRR